MNELNSKIEQNTHMRDKAIQLRGMLEDHNAQKQCDTQIKESERYISYFSAELRRIKHRSFSRPAQSQIQAMLSKRASGGSIPTSSLTHNFSNRSIHSEGVDSQKDDTDSDTSSIALNTVVSEEMNKLDINDLDEDTLAMKNEEHDKKKYTNIEKFISTAKKTTTTTTDLLQAETPINRAKVCLKLHELEYKVDVEKKVQDGIRNLALTLDSATDRKRKSEILEKQNESHEKMGLLSNAVRKYKNLYLGDEDDVDLSPIRAVPGTRRPITGTLQLKVIEARELTHAPTRMFKIAHTAVEIKVDGAAQAHTKLSRNSRWSESFELHVDKATEIELVIYDKSGDRTLPIGLLWLKISDIAEHLRKQKLAQEQDLQWVSADIAQQQQESQQPQQSQESQSAVQHCTKDSPNDYSKNISAWFDVEPIGRLLLDIQFVRENTALRPRDKLERAGAVRERKGEVHEMNGHLFVARRYYHIMKCALCNDFMAKLVFQCEDCGLACHTKCYSQIVTKCSRQALKTTKRDQGSEELRHHIPHRFDSLAIIKANWCCHCGFLLPIGFRGAKRCEECGVTCHKKCAPLVPAFCGLPMKKANKMLSEMKVVNQRRTPHPNSKTQSAIEGQQTYSKASNAYHTNGSGSTSSSSSSATTTSNNRHSFNSGLGLPPPPLSSSSTPTTSTSTGKNTQSLGYSKGILSFQSIPEAVRSSTITRPNASNPGRTSQLMFVKKTPVHTNKKVSLGDFNFLAVLGKGNFGKVMLAEEKYTSELYAIKVLKKRFVLDNEEVASTKSEKSVFQTANQGRHPFLANLHSTFQTETRVYFVMEYISGGDLMMQIQREKFSEKRAKFYACEVLLALEFLHKHGIIYRDLKLDNIMLCLDGHIKLVDYGLCKENMWADSTTKTFCGTPEFMAPEIILDLPYGRAVDWWTLGVLLYEMLLGQSPFKGEDEDEIFDAVLEDEILYPINMSRNSVSICQKLLQRTSAKRLGSGKGDGQEVKAHPFFEGVNWEDMLAKKVTPPFLPSVRGRADTSNFDDDFTREIPILTPLSTRVLPEEQQKFKDFSYIADWVLEG
ncbi:protein kinase C [Phycomyces blakesleeanus NRRL 1555(-)]|uniref:protein kinase C n=1 Tax=Phycomyces blakesleeanus (strain ATCC 8743b / DSM 1359 / FGSC 10004 / NBRC 33097 / NRRL 1555) TaxID=763407 RepID=A0A162ZD37_PHYB8|nr:protein kinase C [Phycomyces blakesleeanus NRRL 1555(-)]OAD65961.1 protein kinase C [Phycomyces blakesleeanus NRRL 1555(-)]|eukprot:XP_018284001.1 protein kinase C [Phycomyces blakesleeanus NRRL 1555(-)]